MKRYLLFAYPTFYSCGGFNDFVKSFDSLDEAKLYYLKENKDDNWHVFDSIEMKIVAGNDKPSELN